MSREISLNHITKIEGHAKLSLKVSGGEVDSVSMEVFEGARYFEGIVKGRNYSEAAPLTSRICGVCSVVHFLTSLKAIEAALQIHGKGDTRQVDGASLALVTGYGVYAWSDVLILSSDPG